MGECNGHRVAVQEVRTHRDRMDSARGYEEALLTMSYVEVLLCYLLVAMVVVGGALYGIGRLILKLIENHGDVG